MDNIRFYRRLVDNSYSKHEIARTKSAVLSSDLPIDEIEDLLVELEWKKEIAEEDEK